MQFEMVLCRVNGGESYEIQIVDLDGWGERMTIGSGMNETEAFERAGDTFNQLGEELRKRRAAFEKAKLKKSKKTIATRFATALKKGVVAQREKAKRR